MSEVKNNPNLKSDRFFSVADSCLLVTHPERILNVRDQGKTKTCYAHAVTAAMYGNEMWTKGVSLEGSVQELLDYRHLFHRPPPSKDDKPLAPVAVLRDGNPPLVPPQKRLPPLVVPSEGFVFSFSGAFSYVMMHGLSPKISYPWTGRATSKYKLCDPDGEWAGETEWFGLPMQRNQKIYIGSYGMVTTHQDAEMFLHNQPIACGIEVTGSFMACNSEDVIKAEPGQQLWTDIRYYDPEKSYHAMTIVGYGHDGPDKYYICQNSYGLNWGYNGYCKISRDIVLLMSLPIDTTSPSLLNF